MIALDSFTFSTKIQGLAKVGLQLWVHKTPSLFSYYCWLIIVLFTCIITVNLLLPTPVYIPWSENLSLEVKV